MRCSRGWAPRRAGLAAPSLTILGLIAAIVGGYVVAAEILKRRFYRVTIRKVRVPDPPVLP